MLQGAFLVIGDNADAVPAEVKPKIAAVSENGLTERSHIVGLLTTCD